MTPVGALRASVALHGYPISAFKMKVRVASAEDVGLVELDNPKNSTIYRIESHIPYEKATDGYLENWIPKYAEVQNEIYFMLK
ncbi:hypothetical protein [Anaerotignum sp.]|uniref:hypothetical protein n=1 Tax=Anaerotignum sp. TaxID=2039241 RepID=UPI0027146E6A|nr:hypothetical protein [Anaerotignum sp.]